MTVSSYILSVSSMLLLTLPITLFLFLPFDESHLRVRRRTVYAAMFAFNVFAAAFYPLFARGKLVDPYLDITILLLIAASCILIRDTLTRKATALFIAVLCLKAQTMLAMTYSAAKELTEASEISSEVGVGDASLYDVPTVLLFLLGAILLVPATIYFEKRVLKPYLRMVSPRAMRINILLLVFANVGCFLSPLFLVGYFLTWVNDMAWSVILGLLPFIAMLFALYVFTFRTSLVRAREVENRLQTELLRENSISLQRQMDRSRENYHDLRQLLRQLNTLSEREGISELKPYIEKVVSLTEHTNWHFCENKCLNGLLQYYSGCAAEKNIPISISADCGDVSVEDTDLTLLVANVLENAIHSTEAYQNQTGREPNIAVIIGIVNNYLMMQVINSCLDVRYAPGVPEEEKSHFLPVEAYESIHESGGWGLKRVQIIVDKYQGRANYQFDEKASLWTTRISLILRKAVT